MLQITDVPIQSLVIKLRRAGKQSRQEILNFSGCRFREIKTEFLRLSDYLESFLISVIGISQSNMSRMRTGLPP